MIKRSIVALVAMFCLAAVSAQSVDEIISKNIEALGGASTIKAVKTIKSTGRVVIQGGMMEGSFVLYQSRPNNFLLEVDMMGNILTQGYDGKTAWQNQPVAFGGSGKAEPMPESIAKTFIDSTDFDGPLMDYRKKGHKVELLGKEDMEGTEVFRLKLGLKSGREMTVFIDAENYVQLKVSNREFNPQFGAEVDSEQLMGDYKAVGGMMVPHSIETKMNGQTFVQLVIDKIELNTEVNSQMFKLQESGGQD